jgi:hypothetical protein
MAQSDFAPARMVSRAAKAMPWSMCTTTRSISSQIGSDLEPGGGMDAQLVGYNPTMLLKLARLLAVMVALVVPLQGMATVAASQCMALGHHQDARDSGHAHDDADGHHHDAQSHADGGKHAEESGTSAHCGPCATCCASASIASPSDVPILRPATIAQYVFSQFPPTGIEPDGVYRPPLAL